MRAPLSIVIPTLNAGHSLAATLEALMEGLASGLIREVIISDGGSGDQTLAIAEEAGCELVTGAASRGAQLRRGAEAVRGEWILFLHADTVLEDGWSAPVMDAMKAGQAGHFRLKFDASGFGARWVAGWANLRARLWRLPYGDQGLLVSKEAYLRVGGYPDIPLMEDVAMARALKSDLAMMPARAVTSWSRYERDGWVKRGVGNLSILLRYALGASPERLARSYSKQS